MDILITIVMNIQDSFSSFLKHLLFLKTIILSRIWISYEIISDKKYPQNLKHFYEGKEQMFYFLSHTIYLVFTFQRLSKSVNKMMCYSYMTSGK